MSVVAVVQARMGSSRLPGKSLEPVYESFGLLEMVLLRTLQARSLDRVILATSQKPNSDVLQALGERLGVSVVRGDEDDVLSRFLQVVNDCSPTAIIRICADNPLVCPDFIDDLVTFAGGHKLDYAENTSPESRHLDGLGAEYIRAEVLREIEPLSTPSQKEHVTQYVLDNKREFSCGVLKNPHLWYDPTIHLDIDTDEDLNLMREFCKALPGDSAPYWSQEDILRTCRESFRKDG